MREQGVHQARHAGRPPRSPAGCGRWPGSCTASSADPGVGRARDVLHGRLRARDDGRRLGRRPGAVPAQRAVRDRQAARRRPQPLAGGPGDRQAARRGQGCSVLGLRYRKDPATGTRFDTLRHELGDNFIAVEFEGRGHAVVTDHRQQEAVDRVLAFFGERLTGPGGLGAVSSGPACPRARPRPAARPRRAWPARSARRSATAGRRRPGRRRARPAGPATGCRGCAIVVSRCGPNASTRALICASSSRPGTKTTGAPASRKRLAALDRVGQHLRRGPGRRPWRRRRCAR